MAKDADAACGRGDIAESSFLKELSDDAIETMIAQFANVPARFSGFSLEELVGAVSRVGKDETAFGERSARYSFLITSAWTDLADSKGRIASQTSRVHQIILSNREAAYVNYLGTEGQDRIRAAYGERYGGGCRHIAPVGMLTARRGSCYR
jgi:hypothetical protein